MTAPPPHDMKTPSTPLPKLRFVQSASEIRQLIGPATLVVADEFNFERLHRPKSAVLVLEHDPLHIEQVRRSYTFNNVVAFGGCTALDFGRSVAHGRPLRNIPTILSTSCLSNDRSVIRRGRTYVSEVTTPPIETIIDLPLLLSTQPADLWKWSSSGLADLFSSFSASVESEYARERWLPGCDLDRLLANVPVASEALFWTLEKFTSFDAAALTTVAKHLHESSIDIIRSGTTRLNAASEHWLFYAMQLQQNYDRSIATHGKLVSIGTLISLAIFGETTGDWHLYEMVRNAYAKLKLPLNWQALTAIGVERSHIIDGIAAISRPGSMYLDLSAGRAHRLLDLVYGLPPRIKPATD